MEKRINCHFPILKQSKYNIKLDQIEQTRMDEQYPTATQHWTLKKQHM